MKAQLVKSMLSQDSSIESILFHSLRIPQLVMVPSIHETRMLMTRGLQIVGGAIPGSSKKQPSCHAHCEETCVPPFPQFNVVTSLCLERPSKKQPFRLGCRHAFGSNIDQGAAGGPGVMLQHVGGWLFLFEEPGEDFFGLWMCKRKLE